MQSSLKVVPLIIQILLNPTSKSIKANYKYSKDVKLIYLWALTSNYGKGIYYDISLQLPWHRDIS